MTGGVEVLAFFQYPVIVQGLHFVQPNRCNLGEAHAEVIFLFQATTFVTKVSPFVEMPRLSGCFGSSYLPTLLRMKVMHFPATIVPLYLVFGHPAHYHAHNPHFRPARNGA